MKNNVFLLLFLAHVSIGQTKILHPEAYLQIVRNYHPLAKQASIGIQKSEAQILQARGAFDPILSHYSAQKKLDGKNYFTSQNPELSIPTWYGIELSAGSQNLLGNRTDPSQTLGQIQYYGLLVPLGKNLLIDKRRAALQQAKLMNKMAYETQRSMLNDLLMDAMEAYWSWVKSYRVLQIVQKNRDIATLRVDFVKRMVALGERPAVDTLEALTQQQSFENAFQAKLLEFDNAGLDLSVFLWQENNTPVMLEKDVFPGELDQAFGLLAQFDLQLPSLLEKANSNHPELNAYQFKIDALNVEKKLKFQGLLPKLDLSYQRLSHEGSPIDASSWLNNNFYYGLKFEMPLRLSQGRAEYQQAKLKVQEESLNQSQKKQQIQVKIGRYFNQFESLRRQIETQEKATTNYFALVKAEETRFAQGESSLFLINSRETKAMEAAEKLTDLKAYLFKTIYALQASAGVLM